MSAPTRPADAAPPSAVPTAPSGADVAELIACHTNNADAWRHAGVTKAADMHDRFAAVVRGLLAEVERLRGDAERLDWLDARVKDAGFWHDLVLMHDSEDGVWLARVERGEVRGARALDESEHPLADIRECIDAARSTSGAP